MPSFMDRSVSSRRHRILLLTFTRRAAEEMIRRVKRITATALGTQQSRDASRWFG
jgi:superfamily I DNA/RNA helicase